VRLTNQGARRGTPEGGGGGSPKAEARARGAVEGWFRGATGRRNRRCGHN
jgi:hypothetical protein